MQRADGTPLPPAVVDMQPPLFLRLRSSACALLSVAALAGGLLLAARVALRLAAWQPLLTAVLAGGLVAWCATSYVVCSRPYQPALPAARPKAPAAPPPAGEPVNGKKTD